MAAKHPENLRARFPNPIFVSEYEKNADEDEIRALTWLGSELIVSRDALFEAIRQAELLVHWLSRGCRKFAGNTNNMSTRCMW